MACSIRPDGWSVTIQRLLRLYSFTSFQSLPDTRKPPNPHQTRHPTGKIWRSILAQSIFADLSLGLTVGRRFIRLEYLGLSGVILYELPNAGRLGVGGASGALTLQEVFGADDDPEDLGMDVDHLLDRVGARLIYAPAYACTSFVVGQVMNALIHSHRMRPIATAHGILVDSAAFTLFDSVNVGPTPYAPKPTIDVLSYLKPAARMKRSASSPPPFPPSQPLSDDHGELFNDLDLAQDDASFDSSTSSIDSLGPCTPPHSRSGTPIIVTSDELPSPSFEPLENDVLSDRSNFLDKAPGVTRCTNDGAARPAPTQSSPKEKENRRGGRAVV